MPLAWNFFSASDPSCKPQFIWINQSPLKRAKAGEVAQPWLDSCSTGCSHALLKISPDQVGEWWRVSPCTLGCCTLGMPPGWPWPVFTKWRIQSCEGTSPFNVFMLGGIWLFATPQTLACQAPPLVEFSRQDYWSGLQFPTPRGLSHPGIKPASLALQADSLPLSHLGSFVYYVQVLNRFTPVPFFEAPWTVAPQVSLSKGFSWQEYCSGLPCPAPRDIPDTGMEPASLTPALSNTFFTTSATWVNTMMLLKRSSDSYEAVCKAVFKYPCFL